MSPGNPIMQLFGRSPIKPLQEHMTCVHKSAKELLPFFKAVVNQDWKQAESIQQQICTLEKSADALKHDIRLHLPSGFFMPVARADLLKMLSNQDKVANKAKDIAGLVFGRKMCIPEQVAKNFLQFVETCVQTSAKAHEAINELDNLLEAGFKGQEVQAVRELLQQIDNLEHETDEQQVDLRQQLYAIEQDFPPIDMMFLYKLFDLTGALADKAQEVGGQLEVLLAR